MTDLDRLTLITWQAREYDRGRIGPLDLLDLLAEHGRIDARVRAPLSRWVAGPRHSQESEHPRVQEICREGRMRHVRVGPRQRAGELTLLAQREVFGKVLLSTLRRLADCGQVRLQRDKHGRITRVARAPRRGA
jgi:hypothetical protein